MVLRSGPACSGFSSILPAYAARRLAIFHCLQAIFLIGACFSCPSEGKYRKSDGDEVGEEEDKLNNYHKFLDEKILRRFSSRRFALFSFECKEEKAAVAFIFKLKLRFFLFFSCFLFFSLRFLKINTKISLEKTQQRSRSRSPSSTGIGCRFMKEKPQVEIINIFFIYLCAYLHIALYLYFSFFLRMVVKNEE